MTRVIAILQARMSSTRLPGKVIKPLPYLGGPSILERVLTRLKDVDLFDQVFVATSENIENDSIVSLCNALEVDVLRGSEHDVHRRFYQIVKNQKVDHVFRFTADNPIILEDIVQKVFEYHIQQANDHTVSTFLPYGLNVELFRAQAFLQKSVEDLTPDEKEHVTLFFRTREGYRAGEFIEHLSWLDASQYRFTVDYPVDYSFMSLLFERLKKTDIRNLSDLKQIVEFEEQWLFDINRHVLQKNHADLHSEIIFSINHLKAIGCVNAALKLENSIEENPKSVHKD